METGAPPSTRPKITKPKPLTVLPAPLPPQQEKIQYEEGIPENEPLGQKAPKTVRAPRGPREKKVVSEMDYLEKKIKEQPLTVEDWVKARIQFPKIFKFTEEGDLDVPPIKPSDTRKIIRFEKYIPATSKYTMDFLNIRRNGAIKPEEEYTIAKRKLQQLVASFDPNSGDITVDDILDANEEVKVAECAVSAAVKMPRNIVMIDEIQQSMLNFNWYDRAKNPEIVLSAEYTMFPVQAFWMPQGEQVVEPQPNVLPTKINLDEEEENDEDAEINQQGGRTNRIVTNQVRGIIGARARMNSA
jgi:hypothetical protein